MYGLLAEEMLVAPDKSSITFRLHPKARFYNGDPVTAADVKYSFDSLSGKYAAPSYQTALAGVAARAWCSTSARCASTSKERTNDMVFTVGGAAGVLAQVGARRRRQAAGPSTRSSPSTRSPAARTRSTRPTRAGASSSSATPTTGRATCRVRRGIFNFDRVVYRYYQDQAVAREAFKAGEFDIFKEYGARSWVRQHKGPKWDDGRIKKDLFETGVGQGLQAYELNLRRPMFQDIRVREALGYTYDFDTLNRLGLFKRANSVFNNSDFAAEGLPSPGELKLLEPFRAELPPAGVRPGLRRADARAATRSGCARTC